MNATFVIAYDPNVLDAHNALMPASLLASVLTIAAASVHTRTSFADTGPVSVASSRLATFAAIASAAAATFAYLMVSYMPAAAVRGSCEWAPFWTALNLVFSLSAIGTAMVFAGGGGGEAFSDPYSLDGPSLGSDEESAHAIIARSPIAAHPAALLVTIVFASALSSIPEREDPKALHTLAGTTLAILAVTGVAAIVARITRHWRGGVFERLGCCALMGERESSLMPGRAEHSAIYVITELHYGLVLLAHAIFATLTAYTCVDVYVAARFYIASSALAFFPYFVMMIESFVIRRRA